MMATPAAEEKTACPCHSCMGLKMLNARTVRRHLDNDDRSQCSTKRQKTDQGFEEHEEDLLHEGTTMTSWSLCLRVLSLYNNFPGVTQQCVNEVLQLISDVLGSTTSSEKIPVDFKKLNTFMSKFMTPVKRYKSCPNECDLFEHDDGAHRCKKDSCKGTDGGKVYEYIPLIDRLKQLYANSEVSANLQNHNQCSSSGSLSDIHHSRAWKELYGRGGIFDGDYRAIALEFSADGFAPFHHNTSRPYSIEQQASVILNLPPELRTTPGLVLLHGLIPGPKAPHNEKHNIYLRPLVDELLELQKGVEGVYDAYRNETFTLKATILLHVHDFPGQAKLFHGMGSGAKFACPMCKSEGTYSKHMKKMVYRSGREFLEDNDELRLDTSFPGGGIELGKPQLRNFREETVLAATSGVLEEAVHDAVPRSRERRMARAAHNAVMSRGGRKRCSEFDRLGDGEASKIAVEGMHTIQGVAKNLHGLLNGHRDGVGVRAHESALGRFPGCTADERGRLPHAPFTLAKEDMAVADQRIGSVTVPGAKGTLPKAIFGDFHSMKSHTWHLVMTKGIYPYVLKDLLGTAQRHALITFCHIMAICSARTLYVDLLPRIETQLHRSQAFIARDFPETLKTVLWHMLYHLPMFIERFGPIHSYWMFYFERQIHYHVSRLHNSKHPEASMINSYRADALCTLMQFTDIGRRRKTHKHIIGKPSGDLNESSRGEHGRWSWKGGEDDGSVIYIRDEEGDVFFGRVCFFYDVDYKGECHRYANIHWYEQPTEDPATMMLACNKKSHNKTLNPSIPLQNLSEPLITAVAGDDLFILDFLDRQRTIDLLDWME